MPEAAALTCESLSELIQRLASPMAWLSALRAGMTAADLLEDYLVSLRLQDPRLYGVQRRQCRQHLPVCLQRHLLGCSPPEASCWPPPITVLAPACRYSVITSGSGRPSDDRHAYMSVLAAAHHRGDPASCMLAIRVSKRLQRLRQSCCFIAPALVLVSQVSCAAYSLMCCCLFAGASKRLCQFQDRLLQPFPPPDAFFFSS